MAICGIWHCSFTVGDLDRSLDFYVDLLGLRLIHRQTQKNEYTSRLVGYPDAHLEVAMLEVPGAASTISGHHLELVQYIHPLGEAIRPEPKQPGAPHLAFVTSDIESEYNRLSQAGVLFRAPKPVAIEAGRNLGGYTVYFQDPDGITLELLQPPPRS